MPENQEETPAETTENQEVGSEAAEGFVEPKSDEPAQPEAKTYDTGWSNPADVAMKFNREVYDFGKITEGETASTLFVFTNTGTAPLEIETVSACFCMTVNYTSGLIQPGEKANVDVVFDSNDQAGTVRKDIDVIFRNADKDGYPLIKRLQLKGRVVSKK